MKLTLLPLQDDDLIRLSCEGRVSHHDPDNPIPALLGPHGYREKVLLNLERCEAMDSSGIAWLIASHKRFQEAGGKLVLHSVPPVLLDLLRFTRLTAFLAIAPTEQAAGAMAGDSAARPGA